MTDKTSKEDCVRCHWAQSQGELYQAYHDNEWGVPVHDERKHFEFLLLEGAQAGLSWLTILKRREGYRKAFAQFDPKKVARYDEKKSLELMQCTGIIRNRLKIASAINNAQRFLDVQEAFDGFDNYIWRFVDGRPQQNHRCSHAEIPAETPESKALSKDLKQRGFTFVGPTVLYAHMQAIGLVNDHTIDCFRHKELT